MKATDPYAGGSGASGPPRKEKKVGAADAAVQHRAPLSLLEGHAQPVEGVLFGCPRRYCRLLCSQDHTVKTVGLGHCALCRYQKHGYALSPVAQLPEVNLIASGSSARHINLHDPPHAGGRHRKLGGRSWGHTNFVVDFNTLH